MTALIQLIQSHPLTFASIALLLFKTAVNAFPPTGQSFHFSQWFMEWMRELAQEAPNRTGLTPTQHNILNAAGQPAPAIPVLPSKVV